MVHILARYKVEDYDQWKAVFDANAEGRVAFGSLKGHIFRDEGDPSMVTLLGKFENAQQATAFIQSPKLVDGFVSAGVIGEPTVFILGPEEKYLDE